MVFCCLTKAENRCNEVAILAKIDLTKAARLPAEFKISFEAVDAWIPDRQVVAKAQIVRGATKWPLPGKGLAKKKDPLDAPDFRAELDCRVGIRSSWSTGVVAEQHYLLALRINKQFQSGTRGEQFASRLRLPH
jgi:hypothetical protein